MYLLRPSSLVKGGSGATAKRGISRVQLLGSGAILREVLSAAEILEREHGVAADVWSVTSWTELRWEGLAASGASPAVREVRGGDTTPPATASRAPLLGEEGRLSWVARSLGATAGPIVAASDYVSAVADLVRPFVPEGRRYVALGTDGFGRSDTRASLRTFFAVDRNAVVAAALRALG